MSDLLKTKVDDHILHVLMQSGKSNAMDLDMVEGLISIFSDAKNSSVEGVALTGNEGFFSSGLDLIKLYDYNEIEIKKFWNRFLFLIGELLAFPKPFVCAISGHSPAAGCVLGLTADARIMAKGNYIIGLNEIPIGIVVPTSIFELYSFWIGQANAYRYILEGKLFSPSEALEVGLIDELVDLNRIQNTTVRKLKLYTQFEKNAWRNSKLNIRKNLIQTFECNQNTVVEQILEQWWQPSTRSILKTIIDNLTRK